MLYAVPCRDLHIGNHFARSPQIAIVDERQQIKHLIPLIESDSPCNKKKQWMSVVKSYDVQAVVVRHIGKKMLAHLFNNDIRVFASKEKAEVATLTSTICKKSPILITAESHEIADAARKRVARKDTRKKR